MWGARFHPPKNAHITRQGEKIGAPQIFYLSRTNIGDLFVPFFLA
jgi:hypothetical protein